MKQPKSFKREDAESRQKKYDSLTIEQKIVLAKSRRGESKREVERLQKQLVKGR